MTNNLSAGGPIRDIVINPSDSRNLYICIGNTSGKKVVYSSNAGQSFTDITGNLPNGRSCRALAVDFQRNLIFVGMEDGVYYSNNNGLSYQKLTGLPNVYVFEMKIVNGKLIVATHGRGMWKLDFTTATDVKDDVANQKDYRIKGNILEFSKELYYKIYSVDGRLYKFGKSKRVFLDKGVYILRMGDKDYNIVIH